jgi:hypothetical protein
MRVCNLPSADTRLLLIANDSVYGPLRPLKPIIERIDFDLADVWGATDSWQHRFHLQSFFIAFGPKALRHEVFASFWCSVANVRSKWWATRHCELTLSRSFIAAGLRCMALWPYTGMIELLRQMPAQNGADPFTEASHNNSARILNRALRHVPLNPTADLWQVLIERGFPFLKRELLRDNPSRVPGVATWLSLIGEVDERSRDVILRDLELSLKNRSP